MNCTKCGKEMVKNIGGIYADMAIINVYCDDCELCWTFTYHQPFWQKYEGNKMVGDGYGMPKELQ